MSHLQILLALAALLTATALPATAQTKVERPPITGLAHVGLYVSDIAKAEEFYGQVLGFAHFTLDKPTGGLMPNYYKVNDRQFIEIYPGLKGDEQDRLSHVAFETADARKLRAYLENKGVKVPATVQPDFGKNLSFMVDDPEGRRVEFVQYTPGSRQQSKARKLMPETPLSKHMIHAGFIVHDRAAEDHFYRDILGFTVMWYGGKTDQEVNWVDMRVPDGSDWLEYMLGVKSPSVRSRGVNNHFALGVEKIQPPYQSTLQRGYKPPEPPKIGRDGKWQLNLYDPDATRVELMEFRASEKPCCSPMLTR
jgi:catechol 2,3-dioxygenase-like lactoylglutathione lyase family enzyme